MFKTLLQYPLIFRVAFALYALLVLWASLKTGGGPQPIEHFDKVMHFAFYGAFTMIAAGCSQKKATFIKLCIGIACDGALMELLQSFVPSRFMSLADIIANSSGIILAAIIIIKLRIHH